MSKQRHVPTGRKIYKLYFTVLLLNKGGSRHKNWYMAKVLGFLIRYFRNYYTLHRSDLAAQAAPLDPRLFKESEWERDCNPNGKQSYDNL